jgi:hypothetical protein
MRITAVRIKHGRRLGLSLRHEDMVRMDIPGGISSQRSSLARDLSKETDRFERSII